MWKERNVGTAALGSQQATLARIAEIHSLPLHGRVRPFGNAAPGLVRDEVREKVGQYSK